MHVRKKRHSLLRDFTFFTATVTFIVVAYSFIRINNIQSIAVEKRLNTQSQTIERYLLDKINYTASILGYMGRQIEEETTNPERVDLYYIDKLFQAFTKDPNIQNILSSTVVGWVDNHYMAVVDGTLRVMKEPIDLSSRDYIPKTVNDPWVIKLGQPVIGSTSDKPIIPAGVGVVDKKGRWLGTIVIGFQQSYLQKDFVEMLNDENVNVALIDSSGQILIEAPTHIISNNVPLADKIGIINFSNKNKSKVYISTPIFGFGMSYYYYKIPNYDYVLFTAIDSPITFDLLKDIILKHLLELISVFLLAVAGIAFLNWRVIKPIMVLANATHHIAGNKGSGRYIFKLPRYASQELFELGRGVLKLEILKRNNDKLISDLEAAHNKAETANLAKTEFLSSTAHELRSPLNAIIGMSEVIKTKMFGEELDKYIEYAGDIEQSGHELLEYITDLLDITKSESGSFALDNEENLDIENIIHRAIKLNISRANKANIRINTHIEDALPHLYADSRRIRQVLVNLISNSIKYSPADTMITISAITRENKITLIVADQGFGMDKEQLKIALKKWGKVANEHSGKFDSSGLGLPLAKHLAELHGAEFLIDSESGKGTTITIIFPGERINKG